MFFNFEYHKNKILLLLLFLILSNCQLQEPDKNHGILFLENRSNKLFENQSNKNDVLKIIGNPHSKSASGENIWIYVERTLSKGKYHKLGRHTLKSNNVLVLKFDKFGVLKEKKIYTKEDIKKISFSANTTENQMTKRSFVESFLSSVKAKMYGNRN